MNHLVEQGPIVGVDHGLDRTGAKGRVELTEQGAQGLETDLRTRVVSDDDAQRGVPPPVRQASQILVDLTS